MSKKDRPSGQATEGANVAEQAVEGILGPNPFFGLRMEDVLNSFQTVGREMMHQPQLAMEEQARLMRELMWIMSGQSDLAPEKGDKRFADDSFQQYPFYRSMMQGYLAWGNAVQRLVDHSTLTGDTKERARFAMQILIDALAPTNTLAGNPAALKKTVETHGQNLIAGFQNFIGDLNENGGMPSQVNKRAFKVGENLALSPGSVVFKNPVLELIQYNPSTEKVHARPHLIVPPEINKFYLFDLSPGKSIVEYLTSSQFQVFIVSWRNPSAEHRDWGMDKYVSALLEAIKAIRDITGSPDLIIHAACSGAMTAAALAGYLAATGDKSIAAMTLMVAVLGLSEGALGLFNTSEMSQTAKRASSEKGVLDGMEMNRVFAWLRPNDLIWSYWVNNYLMGNEPPTFDILYWSNDSTRLPAKFHGELIDYFAENLFVKPGALKILGKPIDLSKVTFDKMFIAGTTDHITPWKGVYDAARAFGGENEFILSSSGHIQSLLNPPTNKRAKYFTNPDLAGLADDWLKGATAYDTTWWGLWRDRLLARSGELIDAPSKPGSDNYPPIAKSPGSYVLE